MVAAAQLKQFGVDECAHNGELSWTRLKWKFPGTHSLCAHDMWQQYALSLSSALCFASTLRSGICFDENGHSNTKGGGVRTLEKYDAQMRDLLKHYC
ncbi:MAG: hypothetical protein SGPRY_012018 [Prymnesium sp.]